MSRQIATKHAVQVAKEKLEAAGEKVTAEKVRELVGGGSMDTILRFLHEIEQDAQAAQDPPGTWAAYRALSRDLHAQGRMARQPEIDKLTQELDTAQLELDALRHKHLEIESKYKDALGREAGLQDKLGEALEVYNSHAATLINLQRQHAREVKDLRRKLDKAQHAMAINLSKTAAKSRANAE